MKKQSLAIISIIAIGSLLGTVYATGSIISDSGIITPSLIVNGNQIGESSFTSYNTVALNTTSTNADNLINNVLISNDGTVMISGAAKNQIVTLTGTTIYTNSSYGTSSGIKQIVQSLTGEYQVILSSTGSGKVSVFKNHVYLQDLGIKTSQFSGGGLLSDSQAGLAISSDGKFIAVVGKDSAGLTDRVLVFRGS